MSWRGGSGVEELGRSPVGSSKAVPVKSFPGQMVILDTGHDRITKTKVKLMCGNQDG